jgi:hypothetical protein
MLVRSARASHNWARFCTRPKFLARETFARKQKNLQLVCEERRILINLRERSNEKAQNLLATPILSRFKKNTSTNPEINCICAGSNRKVINSRKHMGERNQGSEHG